MSKFSGVHSRLFIAFTGATKGIVKPLHILENSLVVSAEVSIAFAFGFASGWELLPHAAIGLAGGTVYNGAKGAYLALKKAKKQSL